jgi:peptidoglycan hydrolase-like protein with peptidoglycan-binding domain
MRSVSGFLLLAGIGFGLFVYLPAPVDRDISLDQARRNTAETIAEKQPSATIAATASTSTQRLARSFSPRLELAGLARGGSGTRPAIIRVGEATSSVRGVLQPTAGTAPTNRYELVRDIQKELKRLGCYYGRVDGSWGPGTKSAISSFNSRVNAALPDEAPDPVQLTLLQAHNGKTCGGGCPAGQVTAPNGRCVAQTAGYGAQRAVPQSVAATETLPWKATASTDTAQAAPQPLFRPVPTSVISNEPLPGRMAIGAPKALPPVDSAYGQPNYNAYSPPSGAAAVASQDGMIGADGLPPPSATSEPPKRRAKARRTRSFGGGRPGTPRYNLMLSLGGVY